MNGKYSVKLGSIVKEQGLRVISAPKGFEEKCIYTADINRPALQLAGFYDYFDPSRIQIIGRVETTYLESLSPEKRYRALENFFKFDIAALIICHGVIILPECEQLAKQYDRCLLMTEEDTSTFMADLISYLRSELAPRKTVHGVLVEVYGEGLLMTGESGIGKSETALELIKRGHRLIADDAVEIRRISNRRLLGTAPELIRYYMELRGIGVIDAWKTFGIGAVKPEADIDMVTRFENWIEGQAYDRLGLDTDHIDLLGVKVPFLTIPVRPGRNLAAIIELAAMNNRQKKMGYNAAQVLADKHDESINKGVEL